MHNSHAKPKRIKPIPLALALTFLLLLLWLGYYLGACMTKLPSKISKVLGVSTFGTSVSKNPVVNGESFSFLTTTTSDSNGVINATLLLDMSGKGVMGSTINGPGTCIKLTDTTAVCNNVSVEPNQTASWSVPVTADSSCSPSTISFQARLVSPVQTSTSTTSVNCVASQTAPTPTPNPGTSGGTGATGSQGTSGTSGATGGTGAGSGSGTGTRTTTGTRTAAAQSKDDDGMTLSELACFRFDNGKGLPLFALAFALWLLAAVAYGYSVRE